MALPTKGDVRDQAWLCAARGQWQAQSQVLSAGFNWGGQAAMGTSSPPWAGASLGPVGLLEGGSPCVSRQSQLPMATELCKVPQAVCVGGWGWGGPPPSSPWEGLEAHL